MKLKSYKFYLFEMRNGKKKLVYGDGPEHALEILSRRLTDAEMNEILRDQFTEIHQTEMQKHVHELG